MLCGCRGYHGLCLTEKMTTRDDKPSIQIGWLTMNTRRSSRGGDGSAEKLRLRLERQMPEFDWQVERVDMPLGPRLGAVDPLELLVHGVQKKIECGWDFSIVDTDVELLARERPFIFGVPSSALETAVISRLRVTEQDNAGDLMVVLGQYLMGSLLGLEPREEGAMRRPHVDESRTPQDFTGDELRTMSVRLADVGDERLEEQGQSWNGWSFRWSTLTADFRGIMRDIIGYRPWRQPFRLGKLTAASFVSMLFLFLGAEAWELGGAAHPVLLAIGAVLSIGATSWFLYRGQNLADLSRGVGLTEQVVRSQLVLWWCLVIGVLSLWLFLFTVSLIIAGVLPREEIESWLSGPLTMEVRVSFAAFLSSLGTLAGGLGGNLEEQKDFKARFLFDEEI